MEAKELMCDDLVLFHGNKYKVFGVLGKSGMVDLTPLSVKNDEGVVLGPVCCFANYIEPIPLTDDMFRKNTITSGGFCFSSCEQLEGHPSGYYIEICGSTIYGLKYVHTLQHALRLCGWTRIADSFEV